MHRPQSLIATLLFAAGTLFILAMAFRILPHGWALFLGSACFVVGGLLQGWTADAPRDPGQKPDFPPTVSRRDP